MLRLTLALVISVFSASAFSEEIAEVPSVQPELLSDLAARADLIALVQVRDTDYFERRDIPVSGSAFLKVLIPYKADRPTEIIEVFEQGLREHECYFDNPSVFEEGRRYLVFLKRDPENEERYRGLEQGCALEVLVDGNNQYALRHPVDGMALADSLDELAQPIDFADSYAIVDEEDVSPQWRNEMSSAGYLVEFTPPEASSTTSRANWMPEPEDPHRYWLYTHGISLSEVRTLIGTENLTLDRHQRRFIEE